MGEPLSRQSEVDKVIQLGIELDGILQARNYGLGGHTVRTLEGKIRTSLANLQRLGVAYDPTLARVSGALNGVMRAFDTGAPTAAASANLNKLLGDLKQVAGRRRKTRKTRKARRSTRGRTGRKSTRF